MREIPGLGAWEGLNYEPSITVKAQPLQVMEFITLHADVNAAETTDLVHRIANGFESRSRLYGLHVRLSLPQNTEGEIKDREDGVHRPQIMGRLIINKGSPLKLPELGVAEGIPTLWLGRVECFSGYRIRLSVEARREQPCALHQKHKEASFNGAERSPGLALRKTNANLGNAGFSKERYAWLKESMAKPYDQEWSSLDFEELGSTCVDWLRQLQHRHSERYAILDMKLRYKDTRT